MDDNNRRYQRLELLRKIFTEMSMKQTHWVLWLGSLKRFQKYHLYMYAYTTITFTLIAFLLGNCSLQINYIT